ncbi:hypothetical protein MJO28_016111 [Puccinia striiformis f. sp. tritici]|uniref:Exonuclease domain-containing protein n=2 Tax=Puccinia striiformis f. sp. tritici TaxID=168172 RepID=A0A0L0W1X1_9BASI|nr:hypothetical protein Pst134EA_028859 [Puccinia striiformis f. sp. tritici]KAH9446871.1 hypothetical protein Pst134EA_028859 [Puccinia striiformis f. sp. tritici]KAI7935979.1 hypothetical protein MJO29_015282 [Puccinia striiformis f. sp. tritici]KAI7937212.1 hypothetical protein MJO28_016111 [Puccinia striiformis f. sp. tritici]KNF05499.1 hypothetical protein PSTG_01311 [Puccinia striiformis f. sp. tritici PST-78]
MSVDLGLSGLQESFGKLNCVEDSPTISNPGNTSSSPHASPNLDITNSQLTPEKPANQSFHSFLCIDFESTCINADDPTLNNPTRLSKDQLMWLYPNEIIEWPVILLQWRTSQRGNWELYEAGRYRQFVRPVWRPILSQFCSDLTGISQDEVDQAMTLDGVLRDFDQNFVKPRQLFTPGNQTIWVTDGPWDFRDHFVKSIFLAKVDSNHLPRYLRSPISLIDLRHLLKAFIPNVCTFPPPASLSLFNAMAAFGLEFEGQQHSGIDDAYNVSRLLAEMVKFSTPAGHQAPRWIFRINKSLHLDPRRYFWTGKKFKCTWTLP